MLSTALKTEVKERPILFSGPMVRAILEGRKTQTRRVIKTKEGERFCAFNGLGNVVFTADEIRYREVTNPYGEAGDRLWVRETFATGYGGTWFRATDDLSSSGMAVPWKPSIFMPRKLSRITLAVTDIRVERLQKISEADVIAEGLESLMGDGYGPGAGFKWKGLGYYGAGKDRLGSKTYHVQDENNGGICRCNVHGPTPAQCAYHEAWNSINAKRGYSWESNPWVWVISFRRSSIPA